MILNGSHQGCCPGRAARAGPGWAGPGREIRALAGPGRAEFFKARPGPARKIIRNLVQYMYFFINFCCYYFMFLSIFVVLILKLSIVLSKSVFFLIGVFFLECFLQVYWYGPTGRAGPARPRPGPGPCFSGPGPARPAAPLL